MAMRVLPDGAVVLTMARFDAADVPDEARRPEPREVHDGAARAVAGRAHRKTHGAHARSA